MKPGDLITYNAGGMKRKVLGLVIDMKGAGSPKASNKSKLGRGKNRRVEFVIGDVSAPPSTTFRRTNSWGSG